MPLMQIGRDMMALFAAANNLRKEYPALRRGWANILHEVGVRCERVRPPRDVLHTCLRILHLVPLDSPTGPRQRRRYLQFITSSSPPLLRHAHIPRPQGPPPWGRANGVVACRRNYDGGHSVPTRIH